MTVLFAMLPEAGHYAGTFGLASSLRARGHRIVYVGLADFEDFVKSQQFEFVPFAADLLPCGYVSRFLSSQSNSPATILEKYRQRRSDESLFREYLRRIEDGRLDECLLMCKPDVLLCDTLVWYCAIRALRLGIPTINISLTLSLYCNPDIPPIIFGMRPPGTWWSKIGVLSAWKWMRLKFLFTKRLASVFFGAYRFPIRLHHLIDVFIRIARHSGYPCIENQTYRFGEIGPRLMLAEIVLCPEVFQLPESPRDGRLYLGEAVDVERCEQPLQAEIHPEKPLIVCSLGTNASYYPHASRFFRAVIGASKLRSDWQFVLHVGKHTSIPECGAPPSNLVIRDEIPQLTLLRSASVMVHHGGLSSIRECIHFEVPMVITPGLRDQPGNAVRAVHHGLALTFGMAKITAEQLVTLIDRAMRDNGIRQNLAKMKQEIAREKGMEQCIRFIEETARSTR